MPSENGSWAGPMTRSALAAVVGQKKKESPAPNPPNSPHDEGLGPCRRPAASSPENQTHRRRRHRRHAVAVAATAILGAALTYVVPASARPRARPRLWPVRRSRCAVRLRVELCNPDGVRAPISRLIC